MRHFNNSKKIILGNLRSAREHYNNDGKTAKREDRILEKIDARTARTEDKILEKIGERIARIEDRISEKIDGTILKYAPKR